MTRHLSFILAFFMLTESLLPGRNIYELIKLPALAEHFWAHRNEDPEISFLRFILMHYDDQEHHNNDHTTHHQLPFSDHQNGTPGTLVNMLHQIFEIKWLNGFKPLPENFWCDIRLSLVTSFSSSIWQPPKPAC